MSHVEIKQSYFSSKLDLNINGEKISPYSELATILNRSCLWEFSGIVRELDNEIFDEYQIDFYGKEFSYELLSIATSKSEFCKGVCFHRIASLYQPKEILDNLSDISEQNNIRVEYPVNVTIFNNTNLPVPENNHFMIVDSKSADIGIFTKLGEIPSTIRIPVIVSDDISYKRLEERVCYFIPQSHMEMFWEFVELEFVTQPLVAEHVTALKYAKLSPLQKAQLDSIKNNIPNYYIGEIPASLDKGTSYLIEFSSFPENSFTLQSGDNSIVSCDEKKLVAHSVGRTSILIVNGENEVVAQKKVSVIQHQYVEEIRLIPRFDYLRRSERNRIDIIVTPLNAEDINELIWHVSDTNIIQIDEKGNIMALENGKATITVSGVAANATLTVEVKPDLQKLTFSHQSVRLKMGEIFILECNVNPAEAPTSTLSWELDNQTIASINPSKTGKRCQIVASSNYEGKGNVRCYDSNTKIGAICQIEIYSKIGSGATGKIALWCWLIGIIWPLLLPISAIAGFYGLSNDPEPERRTRYIVCTIGSILTLLIWIAELMS